jgi:enolase
VPAQHRFTAAVVTVQVIGDDFLVTNAGRMHKRCQRHGQREAIKVNQAGTVTETPRR